MKNITISKLTNYFEKLPGIGPRQARRFVYHLLTKDKDFLKKFSFTIKTLKDEVGQCSECFKFFDTTENKNEPCEICQNTKRKKDTLLVVEKDVDMDNIERSASYDGKYFVLGGLVPALGEKLRNEIKMKELFSKVKKDSQNGLKEIILAFSATLEADNTGRYIEKILEPIIKNTKIKISRLGRGLSTGTELEYSDKDTISNAFKNRQ